MNQNQNNSNKKQNVNKLFANIAPWYDFLNHTLSLGIDFYWRKCLINTLNLSSKQRVLDLACGTFDVALAIQKAYPLVSITAVDYTFAMLLAGQKKITKSAKIFPLQGDGRFLPFKNACFDAITIAFGIRNISPREKTYKEILRVLKPGGTFHILEFGSGRQKIWGGLYNFYLKKLLPWIGGLVSKNKSAYSYLADTICHFPQPHELAWEMTKSGFKKVKYFSLTSGIVYIHVGEKP